MKIAPSLLAADFSRLYEEVASVEEAGVDMLHIDVMDGHFVPNITMGPNVVESLRPKTKSILDIHLMIENPEKYIDAFANAGADMLSVHYEATPHLHRAIQQIKAHNIKAGAVVNPATPVSVLKDILPELDFVLIMTVNPGFGGQSFIEHSLVKIRELKRMIDEVGLDILIEVDGGISLKTIKDCYEAGARLFVAGSAIFKESDRKAIIQKLRQV